MNLTIAKALEKFGMIVLKRYLVPENRVNCLEMMVDKKEF